jgi:hypothetical protein
MHRVNSESLEKGDKVLQHLDSVVCKKEYLPYACKSINSVFGILLGRAVTEYQALDSSKVVSCGLFFALLHLLPHHLPWRLRSEYGRHRVTVSTVLMMHDGLDSPDHLIENLGPSCLRLEAPSPIQHMYHD